VIGDHERELTGVQEVVQAELIMVAISQADGPPSVGDSELPFDAAAVQAYETRLIGLRDALIILATHEGDDRGRDVAGT
jgi:hypothetical protein